METKNKYQILQSEFTTFLPIARGNVEVIRKLLTHTGKDCYINPVIPFAEFETMHYCRFFIIEAAKNTDQTLCEPLLCFSTTFDGDVDSHLQLWYRLASNQFEEILRHCFGYPLADETETKILYLKQYRQKEKLFFTAWPGHTVNLIKKENELRTAIEEFLDTKYKQEDLKLLSKTEIYNFIKDFVRNNEKLNWALNPLPSMSPWQRFKKIILFIPTSIVWVLIIVLYLLRVPLALYFEWRDNKNIIPPEPKRIEKTVEAEDEYFQNQLTVYGTIKKPGWFKRTNLELFLTISRIKGKLFKPTGALSGIRTVHFACWVLFNKNQNAMFLSNYDGGWESYLSEFIDHAAGPMNLSFGNLMGYPKIKYLWFGGAHQEQTFKEIVRAYQYPCQIWYSAYKEISIQNVLNNSRIRNGLSQQMNEEELTAWLKLI